MRGALGIVFGAALVSGCGELVVAGESSETGPAQSELRPGLSLRDGASVLEGHLVEMVVHEGHVYAADSNSGVTVVRLEADGSLTTTQNTPNPATVHRCTTLALDRASDTLYCGSDRTDDTAKIELYDVSKPGSASLRGSFAINYDATRDVAVVGDTLLISSFESGLWTAQIDAQGDLSGLVELGIEGNARFAAGLDGRVVSLWSEPSELGALVRLSAREDFAELDRLALAGPPLGLSVDPEGHRVAVALGSGGAAILRLDDDELALERMLEPPGVTTGALVEGELGVAITLTGAFAWALAGDEARIFGFGPAAQLSQVGAGNMLHGVVHEGELLVSDWVFIERYAIDPSGEVLALDVPRGLHVPPTGAIAWKVRNPGRTELRLDISTQRQGLLWSRAIAPGGVEEVSLDADTHAELLSPEEPVASLEIAARDPSLADDSAALWRTRMALVERNPDKPLPPATGDLFPEITVENGAGGLYTLPHASGTQTIWFSPDCALMWPEIQDLAWLERAEIDLGRGTPVLLTDFAIDQSGYVDDWDLDSLELGLWGAAAPAIGDANAELAPSALEGPFIIADMPGDAHPIDYVITGDGIIRSIERTYRGPWSLVVGWPW